ncbi:hypothetical protein BACI71_40468 [Bacillus mycoides]|uniref:Transposase n=1 Tax=Bacillus mycoides TaxID=1405 RepID=A0A654A6S5_BACMY|nr:hypothetical protein BACI71_40468 [Bacillus mycoides]
MGLLALTKHFNYIVVYFSDNGSQYTDILRRTIENRIVNYFTIFPITVY